MKPTWIVFLSLVTGILPLTAVHADFVGINIGASQLSPSFAGSLDSNSGSTSIDLVDDLSLDSDSRTSLILILEHPIPVLPNIRYQGIDLDNADAEMLDDDLSFNAQTFNSGNRVVPNFNLSHKDIVLYYQLLDNWVDLDMGLDLKRFDGEVDLPGDSSSRVEIDETVPLLYLSARFNLPYEGFYIGANFNNLSLSDSNVEDSTIKLGYESNYGIGFEGGFKSFSLELDDADNQNTDLKYDSIFLNGFYHF